MISIRHDLCGVMSWNICRIGNRETQTKLYSSWHLPSYMVLKYGLQTRKRYKYDTISWNAFFRYVKRCSKNDRINNHTTRQDLRIFFHKQSKSRSTERDGRRVFTTGWGRTDKFYIMCRKLQRFGGGGLVRDDWTAKAGTNERRKRIEDDNNKLRMKTSTTGYYKWI